MEHSHPSERALHLPHVEGLRGLAILLVVAYHAGLPGMSGGYVGVDVFFVLSGYLIIGQLARELEMKGRIDLRAFYARRARRLLPAAATVLVATLLVSAWMLPPEAAERTSVAAIASAFYVSNLYFASRAMDYLADESANPLLHTWSLSVEEQFYLLWPIALVIVARAARGMAARRSVGWITGVIVIASFAWAAVQQPVDGSLAFFSPLTRAWEFGVGGLAALIAGRGAPAVTRMAGYVGIAGILTASVLFGARTAMPSWPTLLPVLGAALLLWNSTPAPLIGARRGLAVTPLRWIGRASYSWYLWHWPAMVLTQFLLQRDSLLVRVAAALVSLVLAEATRRWIENPPRFHPVLVARPRLVLLLAGVIVAATGLAATQAQVVAERAATRPEHLYARQARMRPAIYANGCLLELAEVESPPCVSGDTTATSTVVLFGDSHAAQWHPAVERIALERRWRLVTLTKASCPIALTEGSWSRAREDACTQWRASAMRRILATHPDLVITSNYAGHVHLGSGEERRYEAREWLHGLRRSLRALDSAEINTILIRDTPPPDFDVPACVASLVRWQRSTPPFCAFERSTPRSVAIAELESAAARGLPRVKLLDLASEICPEQSCRTLRDNVLVFRDKHHLTRRFAEGLSGALNRELDVALGVLPGSQALLATRE
jgi:peptidoglycan/LPS O-acetylase OafA/YrhL